MTKLKFIIYFILNSLFWGGSFLAIRYAIIGFSPFFGAFLRVLVGLIFILLVLTYNNTKNLKNNLWLQSTLIGIFNMGLPFALLFWGEKYVSPALASILNSAVPILVAIFSPIFIPQDKFGCHKFMGVIIGFLGIIVIFFPELQDTGISHHVEGMVAIFLMSISYSIGILWTRKISHKVEQEVNLFYNLLGALLFLVIFNLFQIRQIILPAFSYTAVLAVIYLGIFSTGLAYLIFNKIIKEVGSIQASAVTFFVPLIAIILDMIFLGQIPQMNESVGACLVLTALFFINRHPKTTLRLRSGQANI